MSPLSKVKSEKVACPRCETFPNLATGPTAIYMWPPLGHTLGKIKAAAKLGERSEPISNGVMVYASAKQRAAFFKNLEETLTRGEQSDTHCLIHDGSDEPTLADFGNVSSLRRVISLYTADWLLDVLQQNRLVSMFQPIVHTKRPAEPFAHESLLRWQDVDGATLPPGRLFEAAKDADLLFQLDRSAREVHIRNAAHLGIQSKLFVNFTPTAIYDPRNCLRTTFQIIDEVGLSPEQIVFEVIETERIDNPSHLKAILTYYKQNGFGVALDDLGAGHSTLQMLGELRPDYVKLDMDMVRNVHKNRFKAETLRHVIELAHTFNIEVIAEGIETVEEAGWLTSQGVDYMQGFFFARPAEAPVTIVDRRT